MLWKFISTIIVIARKDVRIWLRQPTNMAATIIPPLAFLLIQALGAAAVGRSPVALVVQDPGPQAAQIADAIRKAAVFRLQETDAVQAQVLLQNLEVVAIITLPPDFSQRMATHQPSPINVTVKNLNLDFTNDIRRAVPDAITQYYQAQGDASPIKLTMQEHDLRARDVELFQYAVLPNLMLLLMLSGLVTGGLATAREWETYTVKELLLSPTSRAAVVAGKVLAGFFTSLILGVLVFGLAYLVGWVQPEGIYWLTTLLILALVSLFGSGLGVAVGARLQKLQPAIGVSLNLAFYLFFLSGGIGVIAFEPDWLQNIAAFVPLTYGIHALQMAVFYSSADQLGRDVAVLVVSALATLILGTLAVQRGLGS